MASLKATELADKLSLSRGRISQLTKSGVFDGCYKGEGRNRRFDLQLCADAIGKKLDPGQMMGNGSGTRKAVAQIKDGGQLPLENKQKPKQKADSGLSDDDDDGYRLARAQKATEEARKLRRQNAVEEGSFVLASEVALQTKRLIAQEVAEFESVLRDGARIIADELGVDFKQTRAILIERWRAHRYRRTAALEEQAAQAEATEAERKADF